MKHLAKRAFSLLLAALMVLSLIPANTPHVHAAVNDVSFGYTSVASSPKGSGLTPTADLMKIGVSGTTFYGVYALKDSLGLKLTNSADFLDANYNGNVTVTVEYLADASVVYSGNTLSFTQDFVLQYPTTDGTWKEVAPSSVADSTLSSNQGTVLPAKVATFRLYDVSLVGSKSGVDNLALIIKKTGSATYFPLRSVKISKRVPEVVFNNYTNYLYDNEEPVAITISHLGADEKPIFVRATINKNGEPTSLNEDLILNGQTATALPGGATNFVICPVDQLKLHMDEAAEYEVILKVYYNGTSTSNMAAKTYKISRVATFEQRIVDSNGTPWYAVKLKSSAYADKAPTYFVFSVLDGEGNIVLDSQGAERVYGTELTYGTSETRNKLTDLTIIRTLQPGTYTIKVDAYKNSDMTELCGTVTGQYSAVCKHTNAPKNDCTVEVVCPDCNETIPAANETHNYENYTESKAATCVANAEETGKCANCDATDTREVANSATGEHTWNDADYENPKTCSVCGETEGEPLERPGTCECGGKAVGARDHVCNELKWTEVPANEALDPNVFAVGGNFKLMGDVTCTNQIAVSGSATELHIDLNGYTLKNSMGFRVISCWGASSLTSLTITDSSEAGTGKILAYGTFETEGGIIAACKNVTVKIYAGTLDASGYKLNSSWAGGSAIFMTDNAKLYVYDGEIIGGTSSKNGSTIDINSKTAEATIYDGTIRSGRSEGSGGNFRVAGTLNIHGGEIYAGAAGKVGAVTAANGAGNIIVTTGTLNMTGGEIYGGSGSFGYNIYSEGTMNLSGGEIVGGVQVGGSANVNISGSIKINAGDGYNLALGDNNKVIVTGALNVGETPNIKVRTSTGRVFAIGDGVELNESNIGFFGSSTEGTVVAMKDGGFAISCAHVWADADCDTPKTCSRCGETEGEALGHDWADATCTAPKTCSVCGATEGSATGEHKYENYTESKAATCVANAEETGKCATCDATDTREVADSATGEHKYENYTESKAATCVANAEETGKCATCDATDTREVADSATGEHTWTNYVPNGDATCAADGTKTAVCDVEGCEAKDTLPDLGSATGEHTWTNYVPNGDATCAADGTKTAVCDVEGCEAKDTLPDLGSATGEHTWTNYVPNGDATCTADGTKTAVCDVAGCEAKDTLPDENSALDHTFDNDQDGTCNRCGFVRIVHAGSNVDLNNDLDVNIYVSLDETKIEEYTASISKGDQVVVEDADLVKNGTNVFQVTLPGVPAKELCEEITVTVRDSEGNEVITIVDSFAKYAQRALASESVSDEAKTMIVDMLNYAAAAQEHFGYKTDTLVNAGLTDQQQALGTQNDPAVTNNYEKTNDYYYGTNFNLENNITMNMYVAGLGDEGYGIIRYTDHTGAAKEITIYAANCQMSGSYYVFTLKDFVTADCACSEVDAEFYTGENELVVTVTDSMESYVARGAATYPWLYKMMKFVNSTLAYMNSKS